MKNLISDGTRFGRSPASWECCTPSPSGTEWCPSTGSSIPSSGQTRRRNSTGQYSCYSLGKERKKVLYRSKIWFVSFFNILWSIFSEMLSANAWYWPYPDQNLSWSVSLIGGAGSWWQWNNQCIGIQNRNANSQNSVEDTLANWTSIKLVFLSEENKSTSQPLWGQLRT